MLNYFINKHPRIQRLQQDNQLLVERITQLENNEKTNKETIIQMTKSMDQYVKDMVNFYNNSLEIENSFKHIQDKLNLLEQTIIEKDLNKLNRDSPEPWIEVVGSSTTANGQLEIKMDWNDAFIDSLRVQGYTGSANDIVSVWLNQLKTIMNEPTQ